MKIERDFEMFVTHTHLSWCLQLVSGEAKPASRSYSSPLIPKKISDTHSKFISESLVLSQPRSLVYRGTAVHYNHTGLADSA